MQEYTPYSKNNQTSQLNRRANNIIIAGLMIVDGFARILTLGSSVPMLSKAYVKAKENA